MQRCPSHCGLRDWNRGYRLKEQIEDLVSGEFTVNSLNGNRYTDIYKETIVRARRDLFLELWTSDFPLHPPSQPTQQQSRNVLYSGGDTLRFAGFPVWLQILWPRPLNTDAWPAHSQDCFTRDASRLLTTCVASDAAAPIELVLRPLNVFWDATSRMQDKAAAPTDPLSQDQTTTVLFFRRRCVVLKFQDQRTTK